MTGHSGRGTPMDDGNASCRRIAVPVWDRSSESAHDRTIKLGHKQVLFPHYSEILVIPVIVRRPVKIYVLLCMGNFLRDPSDGRLLTVLSNIFVFPLCTPNLCDNIHFPEFSTVRPVVRLDQDFSNNKYYPVSWKFFILMVAKLYLSILLNRLESSTFSNGLNRDRSVHRKCYLLLESRPTFGLRLLCYLILVPLNRKRSESIPA